MSCFFKLIIIQISTTLRFAEFSAELIMRMILIKSPLGNQSKQKKPNPGHLQE